MNKVNNSVIIKGNKYGIVVVLDSNLEFDELKLLVKKSLLSQKLFKDAKMAISFEVINLIIMNKKSYLILWRQH